MAEAVVEFDYDAEQEDELTLRAGDIIKHVITAEGGWWEGELNGKKGMFPENFVKLKPKESGTKKDEKREATQRKSVRELANKFKDGVPLPGAQGSVKKKEPVKNKKCKVMFDYKAENEDELDLSVGQTIDFIKEVEEGWWEGMAGGKSGVFPSNFVEMIEDTEGEQPATNAGSGEKDPDFQEIKGKKVMGVGLGNIFQGGPIKLRNTGKKPDAGKPPKPDEKEPKLPATGPPDITKREKQGTVERAVVRYSYAAEQPDEISLKEGEVIRILDKHLEDEGWWRGEVHGKVGVFPDNFVELIPIQEEPAKAPKKPPPPVAKNMYPKLPDKAPSIEEKTISAKKDPGRRKSGLTKRRVRLEADGEEDNFDALESSSQKLTHLTALRAKGPKKRPPSTVLLPTDIDKASDADEVTKERNHVQPEKPPPPVTKEQKHISPVEAEHGYRHDPHINAPRGHHEVRNTHTSAPPPRPPEPSRPSEASADNPALARLVEDLQREVRDMRTQTVSKNDYNDLRSDYLRLKQDFEVFRANHSKKLRELMMEVDDEKKLRLNTQVEMERVKKLLAETHV
ncbi:SH3 domain-containing kinase-binding protein 1-like isoform X4 [Littorina saxatilis]|uniref:SH3 domain-containing kinase-binding protein 1-like isoform X4 n=1 Tax=Littorina saxatilis TaxID=31220 RepID=UPI0038B4EBA7